MIGKGNRRKKYIILLTATVIVGLLLAAALLSYFGDEDKSALVSSEIMYIAAALLAALSVLLVILLFAAFGKKRERDRSESLPFFVGGDAEKTEGEKGKKEEEKQEGEPRFYGLLRIDERRGEYGREKYDEEITLKEFCERFRNYAASRLKLYYGITDIRRFVAGLSTSRLMILQGISGTGKTSLAYAFGEYLGNESTVIPVQPMWKERTDLIGYYNEFTKRFNETTLLEKMYEANYSKAMYITVLDELNIARVEYYFAEFLSLLELPNAEGRYLEVVTDEWPNDPKGLKEGRIKLPENMWFVGTANNDDSTFAISDKVYDRAMIMNLDEKTKPFKGEETEEVRMSGERFKRLTEEAAKKYGMTKRSRRKLEELDGYLIEKFHITFGNRIMKQIEKYIPAYVACGGEEEEALDDMISKKLLRKLETQNPIYVKNESEGLRRKLEELFGEGKMPQSEAFIRRLERNA